MNDKDYYLDNYGHCSRGSDQCYHGINGCLKNGWKGQLCEYWKPLGVKSIQELENYFRKNYVKITDA